MPSRSRFGLSAVHPVRMTLLAAALSLAACASKTPPDPTVNWSPNRIYSEAMDERNSGNYEKAIGLFEKLEGRAAGTPLAQQAQLEKAFAHYKAGEQPQAVATLDRFIRLHPTSPALDYALYLRGLVNFNDNLGLFGALARQDLSERDQKAAKVSFESFKELAERFPDSRYAPDARLRMTYIINSLAQSEVHVARYYLERGAHVAALNRAQQAVTDYQGVPAAEEALFIMVRAYEALNMPDMAADTRRVLEKNFPGSRFLSQGFARDRGPWWKLW
jgi:outer membrane protein assembly factor BamD